MPQIEIDVAALAETIKSDPVIVELQQEVEKWRRHQAEKKAEYDVKIAANRKAISEKTTVRAKLNKEIRQLQNQIGRFRNCARFRYAGLRRLESRIAIRERKLKSLEVRKAVASARKKVSELIHI